MNVVEYKLAHTACLLELHEYSYNSLIYQSKQRQQEVEERMKMLERENEDLKKKVSAMETEAAILKRLLSEVVNK